MTIANHMKRSYKIGYLQTFFSSKSIFVEISKEFGEPELKILLDNEPIFRTNVDGFEGSGNKLSLNIDDLKEILKDWNEQVRIAKIKKTKGKNRIM